MSTSAIPASCRDRARAMPPMPPPTMATFIVVLLRPELPTKTCCLDLQSMETSHQVYEKHGGHRQVSPRRCAFQCCADLGVLEFGVAERRTNVAMAQHALHDLHALALGDELAAPRVTKLMGCISRSTRLVDQARRLAHSGPLIVQRVIGHPGAAIRQEHHLVVGSRGTPMRASCRT